MMGFPILAIDRNASVHAQELTGWKTRNISVIRVDSMSEGLDMLLRGTFLFVAINADNVDYLPMLPVLRSVSSTPIFIITSSFTINEQVEALHNGADVYAPFQGNVNENIMSALALLHQYEQQNKRPRRQSKATSYRKLLILPGLRQIFCDDAEIPLTKTELDIFAYLLANVGITLSFKQIYRRVWGNGYDEANPKVLWNHVVRLRKKICAATGEESYIETVHGVGLRLSPSIVKKPEKVCLDPIITQIGL